jgi:hypothetical protein
MTRDEFLDAVRVLEEGRPTHSLYAVENAKDAIRSIARYHWRQVILLAPCVVFAGLAASDVFPNWPWFSASFTLAMAGAFATYAIMTMSPLRFIFVPAGFRAGDVSRAAFYALT